MLEIKDLQFSYGRKENVLNNINLICPNSLSDLLDQPIDSLFMRKTTMKYLGAANDQIVCMPLSIYKFCGKMLFCYIL